MTTNKLANILIFHAGAIGDVLLATPVARILKHNFPSSCLTYLVHPNLVDLLKLSESVDAAIGFERNIGVIQQWVQLTNINADLIVDLTASSRSVLITAFAAAKVLRYQKQADGKFPIQHAVDNFLATLKPLSLKSPETLFPTIIPSVETRQFVENHLRLAGIFGKKLVALVPGVGQHRPHRAWVSECWIYLAKRLLRNGEYVPVLVGGDDDLDLCKEIAEEVGDDCFNFAGALSLPHTATLLSNCQLVVSGDTGPAHLAVAVGTPVVGLYGPTFPMRSGPYGFDNFVVDHSTQCKCHYFKMCNFSGMPVPGPGDCMRQITLPEVLEKIDLVLTDIG